VGGAAVEEQKRKIPRRISGGGCLGQLSGGSRPAASDRRSINIVRHINQDNTTGWQANEHGSLNLHIADPDPDIARQIHAKRKTQTQGAEFRRVFAREFGAVGQVLGGVSQGLADRTGAVLLLAGETLLTKVLKRERLGGRPGKGQLQQNE